MGMPGTGVTLILSVLFQFVTLHWEVQQRGDGGEQGWVLKRSQ